MGVAVVGQVIVAVAALVIVGAAIRLWARSSSRPRRRRKSTGTAAPWRGDIGSGAGFGIWGGGAGGGDFGGDPGGGDGGGGCD